VEYYEGLYDVVHQPDFEPGKTQVGKKVILPSTYAGSPRALQQLYLDAMSMVKRFGKPDFFITMTANPSWIEMQEALRPGEQAADRPDLMARVFKMKLEILLKELLDDKILGNVQAWTYVVEFQKRGLPHVHMLLIMTPDSKPRTPEDIDTRIVAELPDSSSPEQAELARIIPRSMVHGPCGPRNPTAPCMIEGVCVKGYPKEFQDTTVIRPDGYPVYRRREDSPVAQKGPHQFDARDVVPYNPYLSKRLNCNINIEFCGTIRCVKYLYKYTYKGHDRASMDIELDEIKRYIDTRYVGPPEASWRLFEFPLHDKSHIIDRLAVHVPDNKRTLFERGHEKEALE
jgi:hypothetical protein